MGIKEALEQIADIAEGSQTINSLPHIAKIARSAVAKQSSKRDVEFWRSEAFHQAAQIAERYGCNPHCIADIRALATLQPSGERREAIARCDYIGPCGWKGDIASGFVQNETKGK